MSKRVRVLLIALLLLLVLLALLLTRCARPTPAAAVSPAPPPPAPVETAPAAPGEKSPPQTEALTPATLELPATVAAGAAFAVRWTGPDNPDDYVTIVAPDAPAYHYENYAETRGGNPLELLAPMEAGEREVRYVAARSKTVLGRARIQVTPITATLEAPAEAVLGTAITIAWTGPNHRDDYVTIVPASAPDEHYGTYAETAKGSPLTITVPVEPGEAEVRYVAAQGRKVLARRALKIVTPETAMSADAQVTAGADFSVTWTGPNNPDDYITIVPAGTPDGQYRNYRETAKGSPLSLTALIEPGDAELRYMTGRGARVLARRPIKIAPVAIELEAAEEAIAGSSVRITWKGPAYRGDYLTIVPATVPDGQYRKYADASKGSPLTVIAPIQPGKAEIRYMSGQGSKVLARRPLRIVPATITLKGPEKATAGTSVSVEWTGPDNPNDYLTVVVKGAKDGAYFREVATARGSPARIPTPETAGAAEIRYMSGQDNLVLARVAIELAAP